MKFTTTSLLLLSVTVVVAARSSPDATCGGNRAYTCQGSAFGNCCSQYGWCGRTQAYCGSGCQKGFGSCLSTTSPTSISKDARCGSDHQGQTCRGSLWGNCCSRYGYCGKTPLYCGGGCQTAFGDCHGITSNSRSSSSAGSSSTSRSSSRTTTTQRSSTSSTRTTSAEPSPTQPVSKNARCGKLFGGQTCLNSKWGDCCSKWSYCGSNKDYCAPNNCQRGYGVCGILGSSSSQIPTTKTSTPSSKSSTSSIIASTSSSRTSTSSSKTPTSSLSMSTSSTTISSTRSAISSNPTTSTAVSSTSISNTITTTSTESSSTTVSASTSTIVSACTPVPNCPSFEGPITGSCGASSGKCQENWLVFCSQTPQSNQGFITEVNVEGGEECLSLCHDNPECLAAVYSGDGGPFGRSCAMYRRVDSLSTSFRSTYFKVCPDSGSSSSSSLSTTSSTSTSTASDTAISSTSTITTGTLSSISSSTPISSTAAPPACTSNLVSNGAFDTGTLDPWSVSNSNRFPREYVIAKNDLIPSPHAGPFFLNINSTAQGNANLNQQLVGVKAGTYRCSAFFNIPGDQGSNETPLTLILGLNGANCGSVTSTLSSGWTELVSERVVVEQDDPYFSINVMFRDGLSMNIGVDSVFVRPVEDLPGFCPSNPAVTLSSSPISGTTAATTTPPLPTISEP